MIQAEREAISRTTRRSTLLVRATNFSLVNLRWTFSAQADAKSAALGSTRDIPPTTTAPRRPPTGLTGTPFTADPGCTRATARQHSGQPQGRTDMADRRGTTPSATPPTKDTTGRRALALFAPYRGRLTLIALAILVTSALGVVTPFLTQRVFDDALFVAGGPRIGLLAGLVGAMIGVAAVSPGIGNGQTYPT